MNQLFTIQSDYEFYCYLKAHLPAEYSIISVPSKSYYSEWYFCYKIYRKNKLLEQIEGNFKDIQQGFLVNKAKQWMEKNVNRK